MALEIDANWIGNVAERLVRCEQLLKQPAKMDNVLRAELDNIFQKFPALEKQAAIVAEFVRVQENPWPKILELQGRIDTQFTRIAALEAKVTDLKMFCGALDLRTKATHEFAGSFSKRLNELFVVLGQALQSAKPKRSHKRKPKPKKGT